MSADVWFRADLARTLAAAAYALQTADNADFQHGVTATLTTLSLAFGLRPADVVKLSTQTERRGRQ